MRRSPRFLFAGWLLLVIAGHTWFTSSQYQPGAPTEPLRDWPADTPIPRSDGRPIVLVFVHPLCPCTDATFAELRKAMRTAAFDLVVVAFAPDPSWEVADSRLPEAYWVRDSGRETERFGARTSGQVILYNGDGRLVFQGGLTGSRGEQGDNPGIAALMGHLRGVGGLSETPVFGCPIR